MGERGVAVCAALLACSAVDGGETPTEFTEREIVGGTAVNGPRADALGAVGLVGWRDASNRYSSYCSATLVTPSHALTAAHCTCGKDTDTWDLVLPRTAAAEPTYRCTATPQGPRNADCYPGRIVAHPRHRCGREVLRTSSHDLAVVHLERPVPAAVAVPLPPYLGQDHAQWYPGAMDSAGFGAFHDDSEGCWDPDPPRADEFVRRTFSPIAFVESDPCGDLFDLNCMVGRYWHSPWGSPQRTSKGDSGGPLIGTRGTERLLLGVLFGTKCADILQLDPEKNVWAPTGGEHVEPRPRLGFNAPWLAEQLRVSLSADRHQVRTGAMLAATQRISVNDRANVARTSPPRGDARIVGLTHDTLVTIRNDARVRAVINAGVTQLLDRSESLDVTTSLLWRERDARVAGRLTTDTIIRTENILTGLRFAERWPNDVVRSYEPPNSGTRDVTLPPGDYRSISIKRDVRLTLEPGMYRVGDLMVDKDAIVDTGTSGGDVYMVVDGYLTWRGSTHGNPGDFLLALAKDSYYSFEGYIGATIVAPNGFITIDTAGDDVAMAGAIFAREIVVHQGKHVKHVPFLSSWAPVVRP